MTGQKANREVVCRFCGQPFTTVRELDEHVIVVHLSVRHERTEDHNLGIKPADTKPSTQHPPEGKARKPN
jgi:hypothetical protein